MAERQLSEREEWDLWMRRIREGLKFRADHGCDAGWQIAYEYYRNQYPEDIESENLLFAVGAQLVHEATPELAGVTVTALQPGRQAAALVLQQVLSELFVMMRIEAEIELAALDSYQCGPAIVLIGYDSPFGYAPELETGDGTYSQYDKKGVLHEHDSRARRGMPWCRRVDPRNFVVPWGTINVEEAPWIAIRVYRHLEDAKADPKYDSKARSRLQGTQNPLKPRPDVDTAPTPSNDVPQMAKEDQIVPLWYIFNRRAEAAEMMVLAETTEGLFLRREPDVLTDVLDGFPVAVEMANPNGRVFWGDSDVIQIKGAQETLNNFLTQLNEHARAIVVRNILNAEYIEDADIQSLDKGIPHSTMRIKRSMAGQVADVRSVMASFTPPFPGDLLVAMEQSRKVIRQILGFSEVQLGEKMGGRRTATEVGAMAAAHQERIGRKRRLVNRLLRQIAYKVARLVWKLWDAPRLAEVLGPDAKPYIVEYTGEELVGEYAFDIVAEERTPGTRELRRQEALMLLQNIGGLASLGANPEYLLSVILRHFPEFDSRMAMRQQAAMGPVSVDQLQQAHGMRPGPGPMEMGGAQLPVQMSEAGMPVGV